MGVCTGFRVEYVGGAYHQHVSGGDPDPGNVIDFYPKNFNRCVDAYRIRFLDVKYDHAICEQHHC